VGSHLLSGTMIAAAQARRSGLDWHANEDGHGWVWIPGGEEDALIQMGMESIRVVRNTLDSQTDRPHRALEEPTMNARAKEWVDAIHRARMDPSRPRQAIGEMVGALLAALAAPPQEGERQPAVRALMHDPTPDEWGALTVNVLRNWSPETMRRLRDFLDNRLPAAPTPDREALRPAIVDVLRKFSSAVDEWRIRADESLSEGGPPLAGAIIEGYNTATDRILDLLAALPPREPDWLREYERRKLALIEAATRRAVVLLDDPPTADSEQDAAERALDDWVLSALPGGRERDIKQPEAAVADLICPWCSSRWTPPKWAARPEDWVHCPKCYCSFSFNPPAPAPQASADTGERA
jgi:hypothetical protein